MSPSTMRAPVTARFHARLPVNRPGSWYLVVAAAGIYTLLAGGLAIAGLLGHLLRT